MTGTSEDEEGVSIAAGAACVVAIALFQYLVSARSFDAAGGNSVAHREDLHLQRKIQHVGTGAMIYAASSFFGRAAGAAVLLFFALLFWGLHELRGRFDAVNEAYIKCFRGILRDYELARNALPGAYYFLLGSGFSLALFPPRVARLAVLHVSVGDPAAAFFGTLYGHHKMVALVGSLGGNKSLEGSLGCFIVAAAATFTALMVERDFYFDVVSDDVAAVAGTISLAAGAGAAAAELLDVDGWDDNLTLPLLSGVFLQLAVGRLL